MPGAYAHITLVIILKETERLEGIADFPGMAGVVISLTFLPSRESPCFPVC